MLIISSTSFCLSFRTVGQLFDYSANNTEDPTREAICDWVIDNFDALQNYLPRGYPRVIEKDSGTMLDALSLISLIIAALAVFAVGGSVVGTYGQRARAELKYAQLEFLWLLLVGLGLVSLGSLLISLPPTDGLCVVTVWMTNLGYTFEMVHLVVKMAAIYRIMSAANKYRHIVLTRKGLFGDVVFLSGIMVVFLIA
jgi:hypothetical protein